MQIIGYINTNKDHLHDKKNEIHKQVYKNGVKGLIWWEPEFVCLATQNIELRDFFFAL